MSDFKYGLGSTVKDKITGYTGVIIGRTDWLYGCKRYTIQAQELKDGKPIESITIDEDAIKMLEEVHIPVKKTGGPRPDAQPRKDAKR